MTFRKWAINKLGGLDLDGFSLIQQATILQMESDNALYRVMNNVKISTAHLPRTIMEVVMEEREKEKRSKRTNV